MTAWWYLSFAGEEGFRGGAFVRATDMLEAVAEAHRLGCNPGGEVFGVPVPSEHVPPETHRERLLSLGQLREVWPDAVSLSEWEERT